MQILGNNILVLCKALGLIQSEFRLWCGMKNIKSVAIAYTYEYSDMGSYQN
jgi:hypothetical protein